MQDALSAPAVGGIVRLTIFILKGTFIIELLGAAAMGDIGQLFPDNNPAFSGISSMELLREVMACLRAEGYAVGNLDCTVLAQSPKLAPYIAQMRRNLAGCMDVGADCISVKATTEEGLGFTGAGEGIAAHAVVLIERIS